MFIVLVSLLKVKHVSGFSVKCDLVDTVVNPLHFAGGRNLVRTKKVRDLI